MNFYFHTCTIAVQDVVGNCLGKEVQEIFIRLLSLL